MRKYKGIFEGVIAAAIWGGIAFVGGWFLQLDMWVIAIIVSFVLFQAIVCYLIYHFASKAARKREEERHQKEIERLNQQMAEELRKAQEKADKAIAEILSDCEKSIGAIQDRVSKDFEERTSEHHKFAHFARDLVVKMLGDAEIIERRPGEHVVPSEFNPLLIKMLEKVAKTFELMAPEGTKVFAAIRERQGDVYTTILRGGNVDNAKRAANTLAIHETNKMVEALQRSFYEEKNCVILTGFEDPTWHYGGRNLRKEDLCVLLGAIFSKYGNVDAAGHKEGNRGFTPGKMEWILTVTADRKNVFGKPHKNLMKCFNDIFGVILNVSLRLPQLPGRDRTTPPLFAAR
jgi:hypothetical protein